jgi:hypothetical protein
MRLDNEDPESEDLLETYEEYKNIIKELLFHGASRNIKSNDG